MEDDLELDAVQSKEYRRLAMVVNYLALDRPDLQLAAGVLGGLRRNPRRGVGRT